LDNGIISDTLEVHYFDASKYRTIEVDFFEDLEVARSMFSES
jgi:hypothetical protein